jgi:Lon protease-like protein
MMDQEFDLRDFSNVSRLFPLPNLVMFPHVILPLHIFEPRYRQMTADALAGDNLITIIQISPPPLGKTWTEPVPLEQVGCLGRIVKHDRLADGRYNLLLLGLKRVRLKREIPSGKLYRTAEVAILEDLATLQAAEPARAELTGLFRQILESRSQLDPDIGDLLSKPVSLGLLCDIVAHSLALPPALKQNLLGETSVDRRVDIIRPILHQILSGERPSTPFPPPFSVN